ncbi:MAG: OmpA family protein [Candidatus Rokuibacteriota bacterium]
MMRSHVLALSTCVLALGLAACGQSPTVPTGEVSSTTTTPAQAPAAAMPRVTEFAPVSEVKPVHFALDRYTLRARDRKVLDDNARWLKSNPQTVVMIGGHADERGTDAYNLALGDRRARVTMDALVARGVEANRMSVTSYGEQRPVCVDPREGCWTKNRRAELMVKTP